MRHCWIGAVALIVALATSVSFSHAQSSADFPAPDGCVWRLASPAYGGRLHLRCELANGTWTQWSVVGFNEHTMEAAQRGDPAAMASLGAFYDFAAPANLRSAILAMEWLRKAAASGNGVAMALIGAMYEAGDGVAKDDAASARWLLASANAGDRVVMFQLAVMYERGDGLPKDEVLARHWALEGARRGNVPAMSLLSLMYRRGIGGPIDLADADRWRERYEARMQAECVAAIGRECEGAPSDPAQAAAAAAQAVDDATRAAAAAQQMAAEEARQAPSCSTTKDGC